MLVPPLLSLLLGCPDGEKDCDAPRTETGDHPGGTETDGLDTAETDHRAETADTGAPCTPTTWYTDADVDGYGDPSAVTEACDAPPGAVADGTDCDDTNAAIHPDASDACYDGTDADCDGWDDADCDRDGHAAADHGGDDCDDADDHRYPGATELCRDGVVNDCDAVDDTEAVAFCSGSGPFSLEGADAKLIGEEEMDEAGVPVAWAWDVNGDGWDDVMTASNREDIATTITYIVSGPLSGDVALGASSAMISGVSPYGFGPAESGIGDVDEDGYSDLAFGAYQVSMVFVVHGPVSGESDILDLADGTIVGDAVAEDSTGGSIASVGDADGDGMRDLLVGAPLVDIAADTHTSGACAPEEETTWGYDPGQYAGAAYLFLAPDDGRTETSEADATLYGEDRVNSAGSVVRGPGDLDGDGLADLFVGARGFCNGAGAAYVVLSPVSGDRSLSDADARIMGETYDAGVGETLSEAGDVNGDGTPDLLIGDPDKDLSSSEYSAGEVYLFLGPVSGYPWVSEAVATVTGRASSDTGGSMDAAGDLDLDGFDDLVIGAGRADDGGDHAGSVYLFHGPLSGALETSGADTLFVGDVRDSAGSSVAGAGDADADGLPDLLVGADLDSEGGVGAGAAFLLLGGGALLSGDGEI